MRVFISWSGRKSNRVAAVLRDWLPAVLQAARPYFSPEDIAKGARWSSEVAGELQESKVGLLCVTADNLTAPWLMFEAGALAKSLDKTCVIPLLIDTEPSALTGPLAQFQAARIEKDELRRVVSVLNEQLGPTALANSVLDVVFEKWWPDLEAKISEINESPKELESSPQRTDRDLLEEVLALVRDMTFRPEQPKSLHQFIQEVNQPIETLMLSQRALNALRSEGIDTIASLLEWSEIDLLLTPPMGRMTLKEIKDALSVRGLSLAPKRRSAHGQAGDA